MDRTGRVNGPYNRLIVARKADAIRKEPPPLPSKGPYRVLAIDPPWPHEVGDEGPVASRSLPLSRDVDIAKIKALDVSSIAAPNSIVLAVEHQLPHAASLRGAVGVGLRAQDTPDMGQAGGGPRTLAKTVRRSSASSPRAEIRSSPRQAKYQRCCLPRCRRRVSIRGSPRSSTRSLNPCAPHRATRSCFRASDTASFWDCHGDEATNTLEHAPEAA